MKLVEGELNAVNKQLANIYIESENVRNILICFLCGKSKRIRTALTSLYLKSAGCEISDDSIKIMTVGEILHNASLLHDDVIDGASERRGQATISKELSPHMSILLGDYLVSLATDMLLELNNSDVFKIFLRCIKKMCSSEVNQFFLRGKIPSIEEYINICEGKTSSLFEAVLQSCAITQGINPDKAGEFARIFGVLFQLKNDCEAFSAKTDELNKIFTPKDFLGIEKTVDLMDNYQRVLMNFLDEFPQSSYKKGLEDLFLKL